MNFEINSQSKMDTIGKDSSAVLNLTVNDYDNQVQPNSKLKPRKREKHKQDAITISVAGFRNRN